MNKIKIGFYFRLIVPWLLRKRTLWFLVWTNTLHLTTGRNNNITSVDWFFAVIFYMFKICCFFISWNRVNGFMMNLPDYGRIFNCPAGSRLNPKTKCSVWWDVQNELPRSFKFVNIIIILQCKYEFHLFCFLKTPHMISNRRSDEGSEFRWHILDIIPRDF